MARPKIGGIYLLKCIVNNQCYVGSCDSFISRKNRHFKENHNKFIKADIENYGLDNFIFEELEIINQNDFKNIQEYDNYMFKRENYWIDKLKTFNPKKIPGYGYNFQRAHRHGKKGRNTMSEKAIGENNPMYGMNGDKNPNNKFNLDKYKKVKEMLLNNIPIKEIVKITNISQPSISNFKNGKSWANKELGSYEDWIKGV